MQVCVCVCVKVRLGEGVVVSRDEVDILVYLLEYQ